MEIKQDKVDSGWFPTTEGKKTGRQRFRYPESPKIPDVFAAVQEVLMQGGMVNEALQNFMRVLPFMMMKGRKGRR